MPKLFDLLNDDAKKELIADAKKAAREIRSAKSARPVNDTRKQDSPHDKTTASHGVSPQHGRKPIQRAGEQLSEKKPALRDADIRHGRKPVSHDKEHKRSKQPAPRDKSQSGDDRHHGKKDIAPPRPSMPVQPFTVPDFVAIDVETTGLDFKHDRMIEVGAIRFINGVAEEEFSTFINAGVPIPDHISTLTGISNDDIRPAPRFADIAMRLLEFIGSLPLCGHQIEFDLTFVNEELKRAGFPEITPLLIDTALFARVLLQPVGRYSLKHVCNALDVTLDNAHRALFDARASGEVAVRLIPKICDQPLEIRQALAAFAPGGSLFKTLAIKSLAGARYGVNLRGGLPLIGQQPKVDMPEWFVNIDPAAVEKIFTDGGMDNGHAADGSSGQSIGDFIKNFHPRPAQKDMALGVTRALNGSGVLVAEAGTGTGKSLAYLVPAALHALKNNCRVIISTHTRNLQDQLLKNDIPAAAAMCGGGLRFTKLKGRNNYICISRFYRLLRGEMGNLSPRERNAVLPLVVWSQTTETGDIEEQTSYNPKWFNKTWNLISADSQDCSGRRCSYYDGCFLQRARQLAQTSHIVVINHALFYSDICSGNSFLGAVGSIIFDEAHHLESSGHQHLRTELDTNRTNAFIDKLQNLIHAAAAYKNTADVKVFEHELKNHIKQIRAHAHDLLSELDKWASFTAPGSEGEYQITVTEDSIKHMFEPALFDVALGNLQDTFHRFRQIFSAPADREKFESLREELTACADQASQLRADLQYLWAAKTDGHVFWLEGNHDKRWTKLCGVQLDISELLLPTWERCSGGIVFTSATLAMHGSPESADDATDYFKRAVGLEPLTDRTESMILPCPYSPDQTLFGAFRTCPDPDDPAFAPFVADVVAAIHSRLGKNILVLFTANAMLTNVYNQLKSRDDIDRNNLLAQGVSGNRNAMLEQFKAQSRMILLGTDSFWEGVDIPGEACEAVIIPRLPFPVPTHPLIQAMGQRMEALHGSSFFSYAVPEAVIKFRQGTGRLIRSVSDKGTLLVLDNRILTKGYGKQFSRAIPSPLKEFADIEIMTATMRNFFEGTMASVEEPDSNITYVPIDDV